MRKTFRPYFKSQRRPQDKYPKNERIKALEVRVIDDDEGQLGVMSTQEALNIAREKGFDLVLVSPQAKPPVAKIIDYGKFKYQQEKREHKQKSQAKKVELKCIRLSTRIGQHDIDVRVKQGLKFLQDGHKVKIELQLRGREHRHADISETVINDFVEKLEGQDPLVVEQALEKKGGRLSIVVRPAS